VTALGLDETLFARTGAGRRRSWITSTIEVIQPAQLLDVGFGFRRFRNDRLRVLLYDVRPNWGRLATINPIPPP